MGINQLLKILKSISKPRNISHYAGKTIGVDTYCWLHKGLYSCAIDIVDGKRTDELANFCLRRIEFFQRYNIRVVMIFDGARLPMKLSTEDQRQKNRVEKMSQGYQFLIQQDRERAQQCFAEGIDVTPIMANQVLRVLKSRGIECIVAPYEADAQLAYLSRIGYIDVVVTEDSDLLAFGAERILYKLTKQGDAEEYALSDISLCTEINLANFTNNMFLTLCIMSGCDYLEQIPKVGAKTAYTQINRLKNYIQVIDNFQRQGRLSVPDDYIQRFEKAYLTFRFQTVYCPRQMKVVPLNPLVVDSKFIESEMIPQVQGILNGTLDKTFLGQLIDDHTACRIAQGELCPQTKIPFEYSQQQKIKVSQPIQEELIKSTDYIITPSDSEGQDLPQEFQKNTFGLNSQFRQVFKLTTNKSPNRPHKSQQSELIQSNLKRYFKDSYKISSQLGNRPQIHEMLQEPIPVQQPPKTKMRPFKTPKTLNDNNQTQKNNIEQIKNDEDLQSDSEHLMDGWGGEQILIPKHLMSRKFEINDFGRMMAEKIQFKPNFSFQYD